ncbi:MAG: SRPBCC domain-containing protein [Proteobacteria bacterium]|nr:SRPBCC domain-containing protein [Pseudomonadota bacterium]MDA1058393.1 SRPBCC domain-containing protein [Pseudomonadota bacterium]
MTDIKHDISIAAAPNQVYNAVSTYEGVAGWWTKQCTISPTQGGKCHFAFPAKDGRMEIAADVSALESDRQVSWTITENDKHASWVGTSVNFAIAPDGDGSRLVFSHAGFNGTPKLMTQYDQGWQMFLGSLKSYVETGTGKSPY